jgi:hypothetical protein
MQNLIVPNAAQILSTADLATAAAAVTNAGNTIWYDCTGIGQGVVLWVVPSAGWVTTFQKEDRLAVLPCREDGTPTSMASLNEVEVGFARPTLDQHWGALRPCLVAR